MKGLFCWKLHALGLAEAAPASIDALTPYNDDRDELRASCDLTLARSARTASGAV